jgi:hypothetical protein
LIDMILPSFEELSRKEQQFIEHISDDLDRYGDDAIISGKQLFWLRDIKDRAL